MNKRSKASALICAILILGSYFTLGSHGQDRKEKTAASELANNPIALNGGEIGELLRKWYSKGTAAGNVGDYYDNRDGGHSKLNLKPYPQLQQVEYSEEQIKNRQHWAVQKQILPYVVFGNSSTSASAQSGGSNVRSYYTSSNGLQFLFTQYIRNNLYIYPEHRDHDPGHNGAGGYGDLYPTNTPYLISSQGSSGSDHSFMRALPYVLAAFRPEVKQKLIQSGMLMPTIQMILRITGKNIAEPKEYLTGKAHPSVFRGRDVNAKKMVEMAHEITLSNIPPVALLNVLKEDSPTNGIDYFEPEKTEKLADTPAVIARIFRGSNYVRRITVSAKNSMDPNRRPLKYSWVVLRGDPEKIQIDHLDKTQSVAEITVSFFNRSRVADDSALESNRIDIGVFAHNGAYYSPPAFITFYTLDNEARTYDSNGRILEIAYGAETSTISVADWEAFFDAVERQDQSWPCQFLQKQFKADEIAEFRIIADEFREIHANLLVAMERQKKANAELKAANDKVNALKAERVSAEKLHKAEQSGESKAAFDALTSELDSAYKAHKASAAAAQEARNAADKTQKSQDQLLEKKLPKINIGAAALVQKVLNSMLGNPFLWTSNKEAVEILYESANKEARDACDKIRKSLTVFGMMEDSGDMSLRLKSIRKPGHTAEDQLTRYEKGMIAHLNAIMLSRIVLPGIVNSEKRKNYVDHRITSDKNWRDVYLYAPDGTGMGWRRYQPDGISEFNSEGLLVLERDSQGRCIRARVVQYELEAQKRDSRGRIIGSLMRKVKMVPTETLREYEYDGADDWQGRIKFR